MSRLAILAAIAALAAGSANCANNPGQTNSLTDIGPSTIGTSGVLTANAAGGIKGKPGGSLPTPASSITVHMAIDADGDGTISVGDHVTFDVVTNVTNPFITLNCYQASTWVYAAGGYPANSEFTLAANSWPGGAANCNAELYSTADGIRTTTLATTAFDVAE